MCLHVITRFVLALSTEYTFLMGSLSEILGIIKKSSIPIIKKYFINKLSKLYADLNNTFVQTSLLVCFVGCISAWAGIDLQKYGPFNIALNSPIIKCNHNRTLSLDVSMVNVYIFDFTNNSNHSFSINDAASGILNINNLDKTKKFVMFVGGFTSHIDHDIEKQMREAYKTYLNTYLIIPDHNAYTNNKNGNINSYQRSVTHVHYIGKALGHMLANLTIGGISPKNIHCVGHSLGGQMLGHIGSTFFDITGVKISRITALDPAGPCFTSSAIKNQVRSGLADYVEVYHSNSGTLGSASILGDIDFIMNKKGEAQPHCSTSIVPLIYTSSKAATCNHRISVDLWTAAVKNPSLFWAYSCDSYKKFISGKCASNNKTTVGPANPGTAFGEYYLSTEKFNLKALM